MDWKPVRTIIGPPAEGKDYFLSRPYIASQFWNAVEKGQHILITAPRRVGKSSVMKDFATHPQNGWIAVYRDVESDSTCTEFYKRLFALLIAHANSRLKTKSKVDAWLKQWNITELGTGGVGVARTEADYKSVLLKLIEALGTEEEKVVMMLDEFPDVIQAIRKKESDEAAINVMHTLRQIRSDDKFRNFRFVFAGSVGLDHVIRSLDRPKLINDLFSIGIEALTEEEADQLISMILRGASLQIKPKVRSYLISRVEYLLPFYLQLIIQQCDSMLQKQEKTDLSEADIDKAIISVYTEGRHFTDWESRLRKYLNQADSNYCVELLTQIAHNNSYPLQMAIDFAQQIKPTTWCKELLDDVLVKDGYLVSEKTNYKFLSPLLREWWRNRYPTF